MTQAQLKPADLCDALIAETRAHVDKRLAQVEDPQQRAQIHFMFAASICGSMFLEMTGSAESASAAHAIFRDFAADVNRKFIENGSDGKMELAEPLSGTWNRTQ